MCSDQLNSFSLTHTVVSFEFNSSKYVVNETVGEFNLCVQTAPGDAIIQDVPVDVYVIVQDRTTTGNVQYIIIMSV